MQVNLLSGQSLTCDFEIWILDWGVAATVGGWLLAVGRWLVLTGTGKVGVIVADVQAARVSRHSSVANLLIVWIMASRFCLPLFPFNI
jgi:hypothetical protein